MKPAGEKGAAEGELFLPGLGEESPRVFTVSELTSRIKSLIEARFVSVTVEGEVSNAKPAASGHWYFTLKDEESQLAAVFFRSGAAGLKFRIEDGIKVVASGAINVYRKRGQYQLVVSRLEPKGLGALQLALEQLKKKLQAEGLFREDRKKPLPALPTRIGIVTSPTGAAIRDILQVIDRRFGNLHLLINPVRVQGEGAAAEIARAVDDFNRQSLVDVIIVARGGGSIEDLWAFNEEAVARAISRSRIPVISAVGHEIDWTVADLVADLRAPTPSAAAELVIGRKSDLRDRIRAVSDRLGDRARFQIDRRRSRLDGVLSSYLLRDPARLLRGRSQRVDDLVSELPRALRGMLVLRRQKTEALVAHLEAVSPLQVLGRGYSYTRTLPDGKILTDVAPLTAGMKVETRLARGKFRAVVEEIRKTVDG
jgi:exodeoxyribonuclease VII large subunit